MFSSFSLNIDADTSDGMRKVVSFRLHFDLSLKNAVFGFFMIVFSLDMLPPFVSYGGTMMVTMLISFGLIMNAGVHQHNNV